MELGSWPALLDEVTDQYENNAKKVSGMSLYYYNYFIFVL